MKRRIKSIEQSIEKPQKTLIIGESSFPKIFGRVKLFTA
jgi:hypothetical protein